MSNGEGAVPSSDGVAASADTRLKKLQRRGGKACSEKNQRTTPAILWRQGMPHVPQVQTLEKMVDNSQLHGRE